MAFWFRQLWCKWFANWRRFSGKYRKRAARPQTSRPSVCLSFEVLENRTAPALNYRLVANINPGPVPSQPQAMTNVSGNVFFVALDSTNGWQLWRSNGTSTGTFLVRQIGSGAFTARPRYLTNVNGTLFFVANDGTGDKIWRSNGDASSTQRLDSLTSGLNNPRFLTNVSNTLFFTADSSQYGRELFRSDANFTAATLVADINPNGPSDPSDLYLFGNRLLFAANDGSSGFELWAHDTISAQTYRVLDINPGSISSSPSEFTEVGGLVYFSATKSGVGRELWRTDGTSANTSLVADIFPGGGDSQPRFLTNVNNRLAFAAISSLSVGREPFVFDPALGNPQLLKDINTGSSSSNPLAMTNVNGTLFFSANDGQHGQELWQSDLTDAGTFLAVDFAQPGDGLDISPVPGQMVNAHGMLFLSANNGTTGLELWLVYEPASIRSIFLPASGTYAAGAVLTFSVRFDRPVLVTGTPRLRFTFNDGASVQTREALYASGNATDTLTFTYTVQAGDNAPNGITITSPLILPSGASITDTAANSVTLTFTNTTAPNVKLDGVAPSIVSIAPPVAGTYIIGQNLDFAVQFNEAVVVSTGGGTPRLQLTIGNATWYATYVSGSGTANLLFRYTVQPGDLDTDGIAVVSPLELNGGGIRDEAGNAATLTFTPPDTSNVLVDGVAPVIVTVTPPANGTYIIGQNLDFAVQFNEAVVVNTSGGTPRLQLTIGNATWYATYVSGSGTASLLFRYTVQPGDLDTDGIAVVSPLELNGGGIRDEAGNAATLTFTPPDTSNVLVDGVAPSIVSIAPPVAGTYRLGETLNFSVRFSEPVSVRGMLRLRLLFEGSGGVQEREAECVCTNAAGDTLEFAYRVRAGDNALAGVRISSPIVLADNSSISDRAGNASTLSFDGLLLDGIRIDGVTARVVDVNRPDFGYRYYRAGQAIELRVEFDLPVAAMPDTAVSLPIWLDNRQRQASLVGGLGTPVLVFRYVVAPGEAKASRLRVGEELLGRLQSVYGGHVVKDLPRVEWNNLLVDGQRPRLLMILPPARRVYRPGEWVVSRLVFDENAYVAGKASLRPRLRFAFRGRQREAAYFSGAGTNSLYFRYRLRAGEVWDGINYNFGRFVIINKGGIRDAAGNTFG